MHEPPLTCNKYHVLGDVGRVEEKDKRFVLHVSFTIIF